MLPNILKLQKIYHRPEGVPLQENGAEFRIEVSILKDKATVMIDTTGASLQTGSLSIHDDSTLVGTNYVPTVITWYDPVNNTTNTQTVLMASP